LLPSLSADVPSVSTLQGHHQHCGCSSCCLPVQSDKKYQLADWRVRPLPEELMVYARMDTHYLLYIYDRLKVYHPGPSSS